MLQEGSTHSMFYKGQLILAIWKFLGKQKVKLGARRMGNFTVSLISILCVCIVSARAGEGVEEWPRLLFRLHLQGTADNVICPPV